LTAIGPHNCFSLAKDFPDADNEAGSYNWILEIYSLLLMFGCWYHAAIFSFVLRSASESCSFILLLFNGIGMDCGGGLGPLRPVLPICGRLLNQGEII
jgi:hypothetical protein